MSDDLQRVIDNDIGATFGPASVEDVLRRLPPSMSLAYLDDPACVMDASDLLVYGAGVGVDMGAIVTVTRVDCRGYRPLRLSRAVAERGLPGCLLSEAPNEDTPLSTEKPKRRSGGVARAKREHHFEFVDIDGADRSSPSRGEAQR